MDVEALDLSRAVNDGEQAVREIERESGQSVAACYQCGKCTGGCPVAYAMDYTPRQIMRLLQFGLIDKALRSSTIWLCASCSTCTARCPREVDIARVMDALRALSLKRGLVREPNVALVNRLFLGSIRNNGRVNEVGLIVGYNLKSGQLLKDVGLAPRLFFKGKIKLFPHRIRGIRSVQQIMERCEELGRHGA